MKVVFDGIILLGLVVAAVTFAPELINMPSTVAYLIGVSLLVLPIFFLVMLIAHYIRRSQ